MMFTIALLVLPRLTKSDNKFEASILFFLLYIVLVKKEIVNAVHGCIKICISSIVRHVKI